MNHSSLITSLSINSSVSCKTCKHTPWEATAISWQHITLSQPCYLCVRTGSPNLWNKGNSRTNSPVMEYVTLRQTFSSQLHTIRYINKFPTVLLAYFIIKKLWSHTFYSAAALHALHSVNQQQFRLSVRHTLVPYPDEWTQDYAIFTVR